MILQRKIFILFLLLCCSEKLLPQVAIGDWRTHLSYNNSTGVILADERVFCSTTGGLFYYNIQDNSVNKLSKTDGLSDNGVVAMKWSERDQVTVFAYENSNIDIVQGNEVINVPDIMKKQIPGDKTVYDIFFLDGRAYLSCGFGIVVLDLEKYEISETYFIGDNGNQLKINQLAADDIYFYAATDQGIRRAEISNQFLMDFNSWEEITDIPGYDGAFQSIVSFNGRMFVVQQDAAGQNDEIYYLDDGWKLYSLFPGEQCSEINNIGNMLIFAGSDGVHVMNNDFLIMRSYTEGNPRSATMDSEGVLWIADFGRGLVKLDGQEAKSIVPDGPYYSIAYQMDDADGKLFAVSGAVTATYNNVFRSGALHTFERENWSSTVKKEYRDLIAVAVDPEDPTHVFAGSWGYGLVEFREGQPVTIYDETNSSLQNAVPGANVIRIGGLAYDEDKNLWMTNTAVSEPISVLKADGSWKSFQFDGLLSSYPALGRILVTEEGYILGIINKGNGLFAMNPNGTIDDTEDDEYVLLSVKDENGSVITNDVFSLAEDLDGNIWLGTDQGVLVFYNFGSLFERGAVSAQDILIRRDDGTDYADPLLSTEKITAIEVDGSNRKWLGTAGGGAFLVSENGQDQIYNFNTGNSPLLSNSISDICVVGETGEVFFGTDGGIISFKGGATEGAPNYDNVKVYPNPVRENYYGPIAISGLVAESVLKITDISGNIVREIESFGGQAIWDGNDFKGNRVATGVYLVFMVNKVPTTAHVTKILFIR